MQVLRLGPTTNTAVALAVGGRWAVAGVFWAEFAGCDGGGLACRLANLPATTGGDAIGVLGAFQVGRNAGARGVDAQVAVGRICVGVGAGVCALKALFALGAVHAACFAFFGFCGGASALGAKPQAGLVAAACVAAIVHGVTRGTLLWCAGALGARPCAVFVACAAVATVIGHLGITACAVAVFAGAAPEGEDEQDRQG